MQTYNKLTPEETFQKHVILSITTYRKLRDKY